MPDNARMDAPVASRTVAPHTVALEDRMRRMGQNARQASSRLACAPTAAKNQALLSLARRLRAQSEALLQANARDVQLAQEAGLQGPMLDRLRLTPQIVETVAQGCEQIAAMPDPVGEIIGMKQRPSGIQVGQMRVPLGVFAMIYESRPNVTIEAASLAIKSGNACILRGGSEAFESNQALTRVVHEALGDAALPAHAVQAVDTTDREAVGHLLRMPEFVDVVIPRGGKGLIERISRESRVPVIKHLDGNCHVYVDAVVDEEMALRVTDNAKTQKYSPCNAAESLVVHAQRAASFLPRLGALFAAKGVQMRCDEAAYALLAPVANADVQLASPGDWGQEYLAPIISIKVVADLQEAIEHINRFGSHHTDAILTSDHVHAMRFVREVDSASVMVNASTRFADGFEYGLGAEIGISTDKFHARGPVGLEGLTSLKWVVLGHGEVRT